jgi:hypothetical protein
MTKFELGKRLEFLMRIGLVDRTKLQQYKLAFKNPENNVKFQHYRSKILEVFFKIFDIIENNDAIYERVRQQVIVRYRNQKPMKKKSLKESVKVVKRVLSEGRKWSAADRALYNAKAAEMNKYAQDEDGVHLRMMHYDLHKGNPTTKSGKPYKPSVRNALRVLSTSHVQSHNKASHEREVERIRADLPKLDAAMKARKAAQAAQAKPVEKKRSMVGRIMDRLGRRKVEEMMVMSQSGAAAKNKTSSQAMQAQREREQRKRESERNAAQRQREAQSNQNRMRSKLNTIRNDSKGKPTT